MSITRRGPKSVRIQVTIPTGTWDRLEQRAKELYLRPGELVRQMVQAGIWSLPPVTPDQVRREVAAEDARLAKELRKPAPMGRFAKRNANGTKRGKHG